MDPTNENGVLDAIRVFGVSAPVLMTPVALVEWKEQGSEAPVTAPKLPHMPAAATTRPTERRSQREARARETPGSNAAEGRRRVGSRKEETRSGGGGGGFPNLGSASANADLAGAASGGTPPGEVPGAGEGSGSGVGPGIGAGTGGGVGSGAGPGVGDGSGPGTGEGSPKGAGRPNAVGDNAPFVPRMADRREPEVVSKGRFSYPESAIEDGVEGTVQVKVLVTETGEVAEAEVVKSCGDRRLDAAAKQFVRGWRYRPAVQDGTPRRVHSMATVVFELD